MKWIAILGLVAVAAVDSADAFARGGGGSSFMNSPGYQRRLQESRGQVSVQSNGPYLGPQAVYPRRAWRKRGRH